MTKGRWVWDRESQKLVPAEEFYARQERRVSGPQIIRDIQPYRSIVTGEVVGGRRQHRDHLRAHDVVEVGNEPIRPRARPPLPDVRPDIAQVMREKGIIG
jgi:hypothetical protein